MALGKVKPTSPGRRSLIKVVNPDLHKRASPMRLLWFHRNVVLAATTTANHYPSQGRRSQASLPHRRLPSQQGRHPGQGGASGI